MSFIWNSDGERIDPATEEGQSNISDAVFTNLSGIYAILNDLNTSLTSLLASTQTSILALSDPIALTASTTLATMLSAALDTDLKKLTLISSDPTKIVYWAMGGAASAATAVLLPVGAASVELRVTKAVADTLYFYAPVAVNITILQEG